MEYFNSWYDATVDFVLSLPQPPPYVYLLVVLLAFLLGYILSKPRRKKPNNKLFVLEGMNAMRKAEQQRQKISDMVTDVLEDAVVQGVVELKFVHRFYRLMGKHGYPDMVRKTVSNKKLHPVRIAALKGAIKQRLNEGKRDALSVLQRLDAIVHTSPKPTKRRVAM